MTLLKFIQLLKKSFDEFKKNDPLRMAGATAFFTTFALPPILIILIQLLGLVIDPKKVSEDIFAGIASVLGPEGSGQLHSILNQFKKLAQNWFITIGGFLFLLFVATTLFTVLRTSLNQLWNIKVNTEAGFLFRMKLRMKSMLVILATGLVFFAQMVASGLQALFSRYIDELLGRHNVFLYTVLSQVIFIIIATGWFTILFRYLANGHPNWKTAFTGGLLTGILFTIGKVILGVLLTFSNLATIFGASGSFVLILLFVFYSSFIFYYGAVFTKNWLAYEKRSLQLDKNAFRYTLNELTSADYHPRR